jgi:hypothetical protein
MHSVNKANFAILHWFCLKLEPRFTHLQVQLNHLFCGNEPAEYENYLIQPVGQIDRQLIVEKKANIDQVVATLGLNPEHADPEIMQPLPAQSNSQSDIRVRQADPQHLHAAGEHPMALPCLCSV